MDDGRLVIVKEGTIKKFLNKVEQIGFSGKYALSVGKKVVYVTERAVFELTQDGLMLTEIAPGIDLEKDVLPYMEFKPAISPNLKLIPAGHLQDRMGGAETDTRRIAFLATFIFAPPLEEIHGSYKSHRT